MSTLRLPRLLHRHGHEQHRLRTLSRLLWSAAGCLLLLLALFAAEAF